VSGRKKSPSCISAHNSEKLAMWQSVVHPGFTVRDSPGPALGYSPLLPHAATTARAQNQSFIFLPVGKVQLVQPDRIRLLREIAIHLIIHDDSVPSWG